MEDKAKNFGSSCRPASIRLYHVEKDITKIVSFMQSSVRKRNLDDALVVIK